MLSARSQHAPAVPAATRRPAWVGSGLIAALGALSLTWALLELLARAPDLPSRFGPEFTLVIVVAALTRRFGIALPGKGFASLVLGVSLYALLNLGWPAAVVATSVGVPAGDFFLRRLRLATGLYTAAHIAVGTTVVGAIYEALGGAVGPQALRIMNLEALVAAVILLPLLINGTFYVELAARGWFGRVDARLVLRWELAVYVMAAALGLSWTALVHASLPAGAVVLFAASLTALGAGLWYVVRLGIHADELRLVQRLARALAADANLRTSFASIRRLAGRLVPWEHMGVARYVAETNEMELVEDTSLTQSTGVRYPADSGLTGEVLRRRRPLVANALTPHQVVLHGNETPGSEILVPLYQGESLVGLWSVRHSDPTIYRDSDGAILHMLAPQLALSLALNGLVSPLIGASDELAAYFDRLAGTARELHTSAHQVTGSAARAEQDAVQATRFVATGSQRAVALAEATSEVADAGAETMAQGQRMEQTALVVRASTQEAAHRLARLREAVAQGTSEMTRLRAAAQQVEEFSETIAGIANQTNLLALNATIEAARAGVHGRSFAVVAEEVGKLAHESSREAQNVARSVEETRRALDRAAALLERLGSDMAAVVTTSGAWLDQLEAIVIAAERTAAVGRRIAEMAGSNRSASSEIVAELTQAEAVARQAAQEVEAVARAAHQQLAAVERLTRGTSEISTLAAGLTRAMQFIRGDGAS